MNVQIFFSIFNAISVDNITPQIESKTEKRDEPSSTQSHSDYGVRLTPPPSCGNIFTLISTKNMQILFVTASFSEILEQFPPPLFQRFIMHWFLVCKLYLF